MMILLWLKVSSYILFNHVCVCVCVHDNCMVCVGRGRGEQALRQYVTWHKKTGLMCTKTSIYITICISEILEIHKLLEIRYEKLHK